ncbi:hypothetical protein [Leifsonia sp. fls2-241-R2A-40a]|uniref:hypothetical protein n=1 Tax=Leifsonia sp. fls2-241-R2A-40a TaxID=3040290 RepID=UPI0025510609|nr:hypothetical protein [Leifsonia sp. fls2-241-R2A-40a]
MSPGSSRQHLYWISLGTVFSSAAIVLLQFLALVSLEPAAFGRFSAVYLAFALASSVLLSVVCEAWQRVRPVADWRQFSAPLLAHSVLSGVVTTLILALIPGYQGLAVFSGVAVGTATYRVGARYFAMHHREYRWVVPADFANVVVLVVGWALFLFARDSFSITTVMIVWAASSVVSAALSKPATGYAPSLVPSWLRTHNHEIKTLLGDSVLLDASGIGTPYALIPILGVNGFGVYRALSNVSGPVKLLLTPVRPLFAGVDAKRFARARSVALFVGLSAVIGAVCYAAIVLLKLTGLEIGTLTALTDYAWEAGVFVGATFLNGVYYLLARTHFTRRRLLSARAVTSLAGIVLPIAGGLLFGIKGAIVAVTLATVVIAVVWIVLLFGQTKNVSEPVDLDLGSDADVDVI